MQATDARKAFPCLDEPHFRTPYSIRIDRPATMTTIANAKLFETLDNG